MRRSIVLLLLALSVGACSTVQRPDPAPPVSAPADSTRDSDSPGAWKGERPGRRWPRRRGVRNRLVRSADRLEGARYRWGGDGPRAFDCSGLTWFVYETVDIAIPRTAAAQAQAGHWVAPDELEPGDLVFFGPDRGRIDHVGLVVSVPGEPLTMVHSTTSKGVVRTSIWESAYWSGRLRFGRRVLAEEASRTAQRSRRRSG